MSMPRKIDLAAAFAAVEQPWTPHVVAELNGQQLRIARLEGDFPWHAHAEEDEAFLVMRGRLRIELRDGEVSLEPGQLLVVPRGVEHRPVVPEGEAEVLLFEPATTRNTGDELNARTIEPDELRRLD